MGSSTKDLFVASAPGIHFELNDKLHAMHTRNMNTYKITHCNTERFGMSALPQMQRMLNE